MSRMKYDRILVITYRPRSSKSFTIAAVYSAPQGTAIFPEQTASPKLLDRWRQSIYKLGITEQTYYHWRKEVWRTTNRPSETAEKAREIARLVEAAASSRTRWENGNMESFDCKLRDKLLHRELFDAPLEAVVLSEDWRRTYNTVCHHSSLG